MKILNRKEKQLFKPLLRNKLPILRNPKWNIYINVIAFSDDNSASFQIDLKNAIRVYSFQEETFLTLQLTTENTICIKTRTDELMKQFY